MKFVFSITLAVAVFITALQIVIIQHDARKTFMELQGLEAMRDNLNEEWGKLQLEQSTWATDDRIERAAHEQLNMDNPDQDSIVLLAK